MSNWPPDYDKLDDDPEYIECSTCKGEGWIGEEGEIRCEACNGSGRVINDQLPDLIQDQIRSKRNQY